MDAKEPKVNLKKVEVNDGVMDVELESEEIVRFFAGHMKELFDSVKGADNYYTIAMRFAGDDKAYTITFQRHPGKNPLEIYDEQIQELELKLAKSKEEADERCKWAYDETHDYWDTECGEAYCLIDGTLKENGHLYCPYCGRKIASGLPNQTQ